MYNILLVVGTYVHSKHVFEKYLKRGYDVKTLVLSGFDHKIIGKICRCELIVLLYTWYLGSNYWDAMFKEYGVLKNGVLSIKEMKVCDNCY
jgi:hypothetical protein